MEITEHLILPRLSQCCCDSLSPAPLRACRMGGAAQGCQPSTLGALSPEEPWEMGQPSLGKPSQSTQMIPEPPPKGSDMQGDVYLQLPVGRAPNTLQDPPVCPSSCPIQLLISQAAFLLPPSSCASRKSTALNLALSLMEGTGF